MIHALVELWQCLGGFALPLVLIQGRRIRQLRGQLNFKRDVAAIIIQSPGLHAEPLPSPPQKGIASEQPSASRDSVVR